MIFMERFQEGDLVYARQDLHSDGEVPGTDEGERLVHEGTRGMVVKVGHVEAEPETTVYLVRFEGVDRELGPPIGCLTEDLTQRIDATPP